jgi:hypothetical protein
MVKLGGETELEQADGKHYGKLDDGGLHKLCMIYA